MFVYFSYFINTSCQKLGSSLFAYSVSLHSTRAMNLLCEHTPYNTFSHGPTFGIWVRCTINWSHSTPCKKAEFEHLQIFPGHCLDFFLPVSGKICHSPIKKVKRQPTLIISFSQHSPFFGEQSKNRGWNPTRVRRYLGSAPRESVTNSPHKDAFFCISLTNKDQCWITCTFKVE